MTISDVISYAQKISSISIFIALTAIGTWTGFIIYNIMGLNIFSDFFKQPMGLVSVLALSGILGWIFQLFFGKAIGYVSVKPFVVYKVGRMVKKKNFEGLLRILREEGEELLIADIAESMLGKVADKRLVGLLTKELEDPNYPNKEIVIHILREIGKVMELEQPTFDVLANQLDSCFYDVIAVFSRLKDKRAIDPLSKILRDNSIKDYDSIIDPPNQRSKSEYAASVLKDIGWEPGNVADKVRFFLALGELQNVVEIGKVAVDPLIKMLEDREDRLAVVKVLGGIGDIKAVGPLKKAMIGNEFDYHRKLVPGRGPDPWEPGGDVEYWEDGPLEETDYFSELKKEIEKAIEQIIVCSSKSKINS